VLVLFTKVATSPPTLPQTVRAASTGSRPPLRARPSISTAIHDHAEPAGGHPVL
jgi:hypothetical protein